LEGNKVSNGIICFSIGGEFVNVSHLLPRGLLYVCVCKYPDSRSYTSGLLPQAPAGPIGLIDTDEFDASGNWQVDV
jgi:hypothetical protein